MTAEAHQVGGAVAKDDGNLSFCTGDAGTVASSSRCRHEHDAQHCRNGMTKGIEARRERDLERLDAQHESPATAAPW